MTYILIQLVLTIIRILEFLMFARAIFSWFPQMQNSSIAEFLYMVTEPIILPFRSLLDRFRGMRMMPIDLSFLCAFVALEFLRMLLYYSVY